VVSKFVYTHEQREDFFEFASVMTTRGHAYKLYKPRCSSAVRYNFFTERVIDVWNNLPLTVNFASLMTFRRSIDLRMLISLNTLSRLVDFIILCTSFYFVFYFVFL